MPFRVLSRSWLLVAFAVVGIAGAPSVAARPVSAAIHSGGPATVKDEGSTIVFTDRYRAFIVLFTRAAGAYVTNRSAGSASKPIDLAAVALCRAASATVTHGEQRAKRVVLRWRRTVILKALAGDCRTDPLRDQHGDVDDPLALVDARLHVVAHPDR